MPKVATLNYAAAVRGDHPRPSAVTSATPPPPPPSPSQGWFPIFPSFSTLVVVIARRV